MERFDFILKTENPKMYLKRYKRVLRAEKRDYQLRMISLILMIPPHHLEKYQDEMLEIEKTIEQIDAWIYYDSN